LSILASTDGDLAARRHTGMPSVMGYVQDIDAITSEFKCTVIP
jgi:hypothetical protein